MAEIGLPGTFLDKYGIPLLGHIKAFITMRVLQQYVDIKASFTRPSVNTTATNATVVAARTVTQPGPSCAACETCASQSHNGPNQPHLA